MWLGILPTPATNAASSRSRWGAQCWCMVGARPHVPWELQLPSHSLSSLGDVLWLQDVGEDKAGGC